MRITCPQCGFFRELPDNKVPVTSTMATCPKCRHRFKFRPDSTPSSRPRQRSHDAAPQVPEEASSWRRPGPAAARAEEEHLPPVTHWDAAEAPDVEAGAAPHRAPSRPLEEPEPEEPDFAQAQHRDATPPADAAQPRRMRRDDAAQVPKPQPPVAEDPAEYAPLADEEPDFHHAPEPRHAPHDDAPRDAASHEDVPHAAAPRDVAPQPAARTDRFEVSPEKPPREDALHDEASHRHAPHDDAPSSAPFTAPEEDTPPAEAPGAPRPRRESSAVRDIWARLQAMDPASRKRGHGAKTPDAQADDASGETPRETVTDPIPWERLDAYGFVPGLFLTLKKILLRPVEFFGSMPEGRPKGKALVFNLLISEFLLVLDFLWSLVGIRARLGAPDQADALGAVAGTGASNFLLGLLLVPLAIALGIYLDAWLTHLLLLLFRSAKKGFNETFRVMCYSAAPTVLSAIPVAGQILSPVILVWYMALQAIGLKKVHQGAYTQTLAAIFIKWSIYLFILLATLQNISPGH
jgi:hypothetical protein